MNEYGRYDGVVFRYLVAEDDACEIPGNYITKIHHGYGYDFLVLNFRNCSKNTMMIRVCFLAENFFGIDTPVRVDIDARVIVN